MEYDAIILGAGGAGLIAAATAGQAGARVLLIDHADRPGKKILISGGGRCNFTNTGTGPENFVSENEHFAKSALSRYTQWDFLALVERHRIAWHEKTLGQLFCDGSARQIVAMLLEECRKGSVEIRLGARIGEIEHADGRFRLACGAARQLVIATGGPSIPKMGATGIAYAIARRFGLEVVTPRPALVPLALGEADRLFTSISGVSCPTVATVRDVAFEEAALFTHRGLSGPAILQVSSYWSSGETVSLSVLTDATEKLRAARRETPRAHLKTVLAQHLPNRLAEALAIRIGITKELGNFTDAELETAAGTLTRLTFRPTGTEGFAKAEVTAGGVSTASLSSKTMEARSVPGLYAIGEAVDVTGWLGGYNFQWAWSSGVAAGLAIAARRMNLTGAGGGSGDSST
ncbi:NAD(P)/FAD-dependent oxidoreductase [Pikeienuella sp. HZG-20]|uniref:NAD(P)/FAD-dependent oxidoreductase n=1 Tax=Paludibacillus litoralis TaxID=3133267 RepID=UPI0030EED3B5